MPILALAIVALGMHSLTQQLQAIADEVRSKNNLPCLILGVRVGDTTHVVASGTVADGRTEAVTPLSHVHIGSNTKAMTAVLVARKVQEGVVKWTTRVGDVFPDVQMPKQLADDTFIDLLSHTSGVSTESYPPGANWFMLRTPEDGQHALFVRLVAKMAMTPKGEFHYSNGNYVIAAAMIEHVTHQTYSQQMKREVFGPLHMGSVGYGAPTGEHDPWPHIHKGAKLVAINPKNPAIGTVADNAPVITPAGRVNLTLEDHLKFASAFWCGGPDGYLSPSSLAALETKHQASYGLGWIVVDRPWADGVALTHSGSNTMNFETLWVAPKKKLAIVAYTNVGGDTMAGILDQAIGRAVEEALK